MIRVMVFNATFNNIIFGYNYRGGGNQSTRRKPPACCKSLISHKSCIKYTWPWVEICTDCSGSCKSNYHTNTTMTTTHLSLSPFPTCICRNLRYQILHYDLRYDLRYVHWQLIAKWSSFEIPNIQFTD
jgi:hypothetical protein